jgi:hypothetical protein
MAFSVLGLMCMAQSNKYIIWHFSRWMSKSVVAKLVTTLSLHAFKDASKIWPFIYSLLDGASH